MNYDQHKTVYIDTLHQNNYIFELTKCCGYSEWFAIHKKATCKELLFQIRRQFQNPNITIYVQDNYLNQLYIQESDCTLHTLISTHMSAFFKPIYDLPCVVVYRIHINDGFHVH